MQNRLMDAEDLRYRFEQYLERGRAIELNYERIENIILRLEGVGAVNISDLPRAASPSNDRFTLAIANKIEIEEELKKDIETQTREKEALKAYVAKIPNVEWKAVVRMRFFDRAPWKDIARMIYSKREDFEENIDNYLRNTYRMLDYALDAMIADG